MSQFTFAHCTGGGSAPSAQACTICIICPFSSWLLSAPPTFHLHSSPQHLVLFGLSKCRRYISTTSMLVSYPRGNERFQICQFKTGEEASHGKQSLKWTSHDWRRPGDMKDVNQSIATTSSRPTSVFDSLFSHRRFCLSLPFSFPVSVSLNDPVLPQPWTTPTPFCLPSPLPLSPSVLTYDSSPLPFSSACHVSLCIPDEPLSPSCIMHECPFASEGSRCNS